MTTGDRPHDWRDHLPPLPNYSRDDSDTDTFTPRDCGECRQPQGAPHLDGCTGQLYETVVTRYLPSRGD